MMWLAVCLAGFVFGAEEDAGVDSLGGLVDSS